ncbi:hypothetical protein CNX72_04945 [Burkholderia pseudomallei]|nr:hypothetical protein CNX72_04945 [Burkholderia pseudomallei]
MPQRPGRAGAARARVGAPASSADGNSPKEAVRRPAADAGTGRAHRRSPQRGRGRRAGAVKPARRSDRMNCA